MLTHRYLVLSMGLLFVGGVLAATPFTSLLPLEVTPVHYALTLIPNASELTFDGKISIDVQVLRTTRSVTLNAVDLDFWSVWIDGQAASVELHADAQTATFRVNNTLSAGKHRIWASYSGKINTQASGLFALDYTVGSAKQRALYTQFEPSNARRVFPSWDEPNSKATFSLDVIVKESDGLAISNMPQRERVGLGNGSVRISFITSPKMSPYLLFFCLGDFDREVLYKVGTELAVITKRGDLPKAQYALAASSDLISWYNDYFATSYPLPKLDLIAAPGRSEFFDAMENWGAIFYFEEFLLLDPRISNVADKQRVFETVAHEVAHQWFGNLVTMSWWDDLWLNEGFASWMSSRAMRHFHPEWNVDLGGVRAREVAIRLDARASTHAVVQPIENSSALNQAFDSITYLKGAAIIRMLEKYVGEEAWNIGVRNYIQQYAYRNTRSDDLWTAVAAVANKPLTHIAHQFTLQPGVPLIRVTELACTAGKTRLHLSQREFHMDGQTKIKQYWQVPVTVSTGVDSSTILVGRVPVQISLNGCGPAIVNHGQIGYFRTLYSADAFAPIAQHYRSLDAVDQLGILLDAWALFLTSQQSINDVMNLLNSLDLDASPEIWEQSASIIREIAAYLQDDVEAMRLLRIFAAERLEPKLKQLGWDSKIDEADNVSILRNALIRTLGLLADPVVIEEARHRFDMDDQIPIEGAQRGVILGVVARNADKTTWDKLRALARVQTSPLERSKLYLLLAEVNDAQLARDTLDLALSDEPNGSDAASIISEVSQWHPEMAFDHAVAHAQVVNAKVANGARDSFIVRLAEQSDDASILHRLQAWAKIAMSPAVHQAVDTVVTGIRYNSKVKQERMPEVRAWLASHYAKP